MGMTGALCFLLAFTLLINFPGHIANPIAELTESIRQIAAKNYHQRVRFIRHDEFGDLAKSFNVMAEKLEEYQSSNLAGILIEKKRVETIINNMHDPVIGLNERKRILFLNAEAEHILGIEAKELVGKFAQEVALTNDLMRLLVKDLDDSENGQLTYKPQPLKIYAAGKESYFEKESLALSITPTGENKRQHVGYVILLKNITPFKELDAAKTNFIATVSHELKTPLAAIKMSLQLLNNSRIGTVNEEQQHLLYNIGGEADRLLKITGELLNVSQLETGKLQLNRQATEAQQIIDHAIAATRTQAEQKDIRVEVDLPTDLPTVQADGEKTAWVLTNLLSNAIRYSYEHAIVQVKVAPTNGFLTFSVTDTGQGIAPQYKDKVFDRYFRIPGSKKEGTGLGLSISKDFIEAQGGRIGVESDYGAGARFWFTLPL